MYGGSGANSSGKSIYGGSGGEYYGHQNHPSNTGASTVGKGSSAPAPKQPTPMEDAQAKDWLAQQTYARTQQEQQAAAAKAAADLAAQKQKTAGDINLQYGQGQNYGSQHMKDLGFADTYGVMDRFNSALDQAKSGVPDTATNVGSYFNPKSYWDTAVNEATGAQRGKLNTEYTNFTKPGWDKQDDYGFADTADDAILNSIMGEQKTNTQDTLRTNLARGTMSQGAYDYATNQMNQQGAGAMSNLQGIGQGVLGKYRTGLDTTAGQYGDRVTGYQLGQDINIDQLKGGLGTQRAGFAGGMEGDIRNALGDTKLFDLEKLISSAGVAQGAQNTPLNAAFQQQGATIDPNRTTGTTGIF